jgi:membrane-bound lytic murein transglycosylase B
VVKLNVMGFLLSADYSGHISPEAMRRCRDFLEKNKALLQSAEKRFGVKKELITALLWVETRLGDNVGRFHVASVFLSLLQAEHPELKNMLLADLHAKVGKPTPPQIKKVKERSKIKGRWAVGELWALYKMNKKNAKTLGELKGSHSGAFGLSQFLPSSYNQWAVSFKHGRTADLYRTEDAILSVAHYLKKNGYRRGRLASYKKALFHYNRSEDYVATILALASQLES